MAAVGPSATTPGVESVTDGENRILTIPNIISFVRLACLPIFVYLLFGRDNRAAAAVMLGFLGATDWVDGYIARRYQQVTKVGKVLDPVADRLLFFVGITAILIDASIPVWIAAMILIREIVVGSTTIILAMLGARRIDVTWFGKAGTFALMVAVPMFLASESTLQVAGLCRVIAWATVIPGLFFSYLSWAMYLPLGITALREGRADRAAAQATAQA